MPILKEALAMDPEANVAINLRHMADSTLRITFLARCDSPIAEAPIADLSFVHQEPFCGGGSPLCKGCTIDLNKWTFRRGPSDVDDTHYFEDMFVRVE